MQTTDDVASGNSLFQVQSAFISELDRTMHSTPSFRFGLSPLDEIFTGTREQEGSELARASARKLGLYRNGIIMFATHFQNVPSLEVEGRYKNFRVTATIVDKMV